MGWAQEELAKSLKDVEDAQMALVRHPACRATWLRLESSGPGDQLASISSEARARALRL